MAKQKIRAVQPDELPDHVLETILEKASELDELTRELYRDTTTSIFLNSLTFFLACKIVANVEDENRAQYAQGIAESLIKTVKNFSETLLE